MISNLRIEITGAAQKSQSMRDASDKVRGCIRPVVESLAVRLASYIKRNKLSGQVLNRVTGDLSRSVTHKTMDNGMTGVVGVNTPYAARQEYGFVGTESVSSYIRRSRVQMKTAKFNAIGLETRPSMAKAKGTGEVFVRAHSRKVNYPAHSYLRSSLMDMKETITSELQAAVVEALRAA